MQLLFRSPRRQNHLSRQVDTAGRCRNGDGPLVGREPSAEDKITTREKEWRMSKIQGKGSEHDQEDRTAPKPRRVKSRWRDRIRRLRNEAGLSLLRGAATAAGTAAVTTAVMWGRIHF